MGSHPGSIIPLNLGLVRLTTNAGFMPLYREGMGIVEELARYFESGGRPDPSTISTVDRLRYVATTVRVTATALHVSAWLLMQRAVAAGELGIDKLRSDPARPRLDEERFEDRSGMTPSLEELVVRLVAFRDRMMAMETAAYSSP